MEKTIKKIWLIDSTLRDGEQSPGVVFDFKSKLKIATMLDNAGVDEIEVGIPSMGARECSEISEINNSGFSFRVTTWCRALKEDIKKAHSCGLSSIHISFPVSAVLLKTMGKNESIILREMGEIIPFAGRLFEHVSVGAMDATRADTGFLKNFTREAGNKGAFRIRIADTVGVGTPGSVGRLIRMLKAIDNSIIYEFHGHNDLGMATGNSIAAIENGAEAISSTVNGLGERAGNARLEELAAAIKYATDKTTSVDPSKLLMLSEFLAKITERPIPVDKPITGSHIFDHESGIHCSALIKNPTTFQPFKPEEIGRVPGNFVIGKHSGRAAINHHLQSLGISAGKENLHTILLKVREFAGNKGRSMTNTEFLRLYHSSIIR